MFPIPEVKGVDVAFGLYDLRNKMPKYEDIPEEFRRGNTIWNKLFSAWFFQGLKTLELKEKEGVDKKKALMFIKSIMGSFEPKHEHKEAACAFLFSEYFSEVKYEVADRKEQ